MKAIGSLLGKSDSKAVPLKLMAVRKMLWLGPPFFLYCNYIRSLNVPKQLRLLILGTPPCSLQEQLFKDILQCIQFHTHILHAFRYKAMLYLFGICPYQSGCTRYFQCKYIYRYTLSHYSASNTAMFCILSSIIRVLNAVRLLKELIKID